MTRFFQLALAATLLCCWGQIPADEPTDPPIRLKKKNRAEQPRPSDPMTKPDTGAPGLQPEEEPRKPVEPEPATPPAEERLDPRDTTIPAAPGDGEADDILARIARNARASEERLEARELGEGTQQIQRDILKDLDALLNRDQQNPEDQDQQNQQNQQNQQDQSNQGQQNQQNQQNQQTPKGGPRQPQQGANPPQPQSGGQPDASQRREERREARRQERQRSGQQASRQPTNPQRNPQNRNQQAQNNPRPTGNNPRSESPPSAEEKVKRSDQNFDLWGHLPEKERALMNKEMEQRFMEKYDDLTRQYYRIIAEKSRRKK